MLEKKLQTKVNHYLKNRWHGNAVFELKIANGPSLPFAAVKEHQLAALRVAKHGTFAYKIPDVGIEQKPFDCVVMSRVPAYVLVMFYTRGCKHFYLIDVDDYILEANTSARRSLTEARAESLGMRIDMA